MSDKKLGLSKFTNLVQVGQGGFGVVYSAQRENGEKVAIKKISRQANQSRVRAEIQTMRILNHRNIVQIYEDFTENGDTYLVMELCEGGSLRAYVKEHGPMGEQVAVHVLRQLISAVTYMHRNNVLHRDLSAGNVFIVDSTRQKLNIKLGDFGLATNLAHGETACTIVGTPGYIAPQVYNQDYNQSADVYSLGGVLFTMLTARDPPAKGAPSCHGMSTIAAELVEQMMHVDAKRRIQLKEIVMTDFMREHTDEEARLYSRESSRDGKRRSREPVRYPSRDARSQDRRPMTRSTSQPIVSRVPSQFTEYSERGRERERAPAPPRSTHGELWPIRMERVAGQRVRTQGGRYVAELETRCRFEVAARGDVISRIVVAEYDAQRRLQTVYVHRIAERRERGREEGEELIELTRNPMVYTALNQLPEDVLNDYKRLHKIVTTTFRSRVAKITFRRPPEFPDAAAQLMENGDLRIKFSRSVIVRKVDTGEIFNCIDGTRSKKEGVHGSTLSKVNEVYAFLTRFEQCLRGMGDMTCFPIVFSAGANVATTNTSPSSMMPSSNSRFVLSNISNSQQSQMPRSAPFLTKPSSTARPASTDVSRRPNDENSYSNKYRFKMDVSNRIISVVSPDGRILRRSTRLANQFIFLDPSINTGERRFMRNERPPERAGEMLEVLCNRIDKERR